MGLTAAVQSLQWTADGRLWIGSASTSVGGYPGGQLVRIFTDVTGPTVGYAGLDQTPDLGASVSLSGMVPGSYSGLQWRLNGTPLAGQTAPTLALPSIALANSGRYDLVITSGAGSYTSAPVSVRVRGPVALEIPPSPQVGIVSNSVTFSTLAFGQSPLRYQWFSNGVELAQGTNRLLTLSNLTFSAAADYWVRVTGRDGSSVTSDPAFLTVLPPPGAINPGFQSKLFSTIGFLFAYKNLEFLTNGQLLVSGTFSTVTNGPDALLARLNPDGSVDSTFHFDPTGYTEMVAFKIQSDGRIIYLARTTQGGGPYEVARLNPDGSRDSSFKVFPVNPGYGLEQGPDGSLFVLGNGLSRLSPNGIEDTGFGTRAKPNQAPLSVSVDPAGRIYLTGFFTTVGGQPRAQLARLLPDGTLDTTFAPTNSFSSSWTVTALAHGAYVGDFNSFYRFDETGHRDTSYAWSQRLIAWDRLSDEGVVGMLPFSDVTQAIFLTADGTPALPFGRIGVPRSPSGTYTFLRVGPDGALWTAYGSTLLKLNGTVSPLNLYLLPGAQTVNAGANVTFTALATGTSKIGYQWQRNGLDLPGQTNATLVLTNVQPANNGEYTVVVRNESGRRTSPPAKLLVLAAPEILVAPAGTSVGLHDTLTLGVVARGVASLNYQWRHDGILLPGATSASYTNRAVLLADAGSYDVIIRNSFGSITSSPVTVTISVRPGAVISSFPNLSQTVGVTELNVLPSGDFLSGGRALNRFGEPVFNLAFPDGSSSILRDRVVVEPATGRIYAGPTYRVRAYDLSGSLLAAYAGPSANVRLVRAEAGGTVLQWIESSPTLQRLDQTGALVSGFAPVLPPGLDALPLPDGKILVLSARQGVLQGNFVFECAVTRLNHDGSVDSSFSSSTNVFRSEARAERLALDRQGRFLVFGGFDSYNGQPRSRIARFLANGTLDPAFVPPGIDGGVAEIAEQSNGRIVIVGSFGQVGGLSRNLVTRLNPDGSHDTTFKPGSGLTLAGGQKLAYDVALLPAGEILVAGTFDHADGQLLQGLALLNGDTPDLYFQRQPTDAIVISGNSVDLVAEAIGTSPVTYQWLKNGQPIAGETRAILHLGSVTGAADATYQVIARSGVTELTSLLARLQVILPPVITSQPDSLVLDAGQNAAFSVTATGVQLGYQWRRDGAILPTATNNTLVVSNMTAGGRFSVLVTNAAGSALSSNALVRIRPALATGTNIVSNDKLLARHSFEGSLNEDSLRYGGAPVGTPTYVDGHTGSAVRITTGKNFVQTALTPIADSQYSVSFWIRPETTSSLNVFNLTVGNSTVGFSEHFLFLGGDDTTTSGNRMMFISRGFNTIATADNRAAVSNLVGKWTHFAIVFRGGVFTANGNCSIYLNGVELPLVNSFASLPGTLNTIASFGRYGGGAYGANSVFQLDDFRLYNRPLTAAEVVSLAQPAVATPAPVITRQPVGGAVAAGGAFTFTVEATGESLFYEWYHGTRLLGDVEGSTLPLTGVSPADAGDYRVVISNSGGSTNSATAPLAVTTVSDPFDTWAKSAGLTGANAQPGADADGDGANNLAEFYFGTSPTNPGEHPRFVIESIPVSGANHPVVTLIRRQAVGTASLTVHVASSLAFGDDLGSTLVGTKPLGNGLEEIQIRSEASGAAHPVQFFRFTVQR